MNSLKDAINKVNSTNGTLGLLLNDKKLYLNLESTTRSLNILLDDLRMHPKRYVNISVFGSKDKKGPLMAPLNDTIRQSAKQEVMKKPALFLAIRIFCLSGFQSFAQVAVPFKSKSDDSTQTIYIWHSDTLRDSTQKDSVDIQSLFGHVKLQSDKTLFYTDSLAMNHKDNIHRSLRPCAYQRQGFDRYLFGLHEIFCRHQEYYFPEKCRTERRERNPNHRRIAL